MTLQKNKHSLKYSYTFIENLLIVLTMCVIQLVEARGVRPLAVPAPRRLGGSFAVADYSEFGTMQCRH